MSYNTREIAQTTMYFRSGAGKAVYRPGALDRIVARMERERIKYVIGDRLFSKDGYVDALEAAFEAEELKPDSAEALAMLNAIAVPGWREWAAHAGEMV